MFGSEILDVAIGVIFVFFVVSLLCSAIREGIEAWLKTRATHLEEGICELLHDRDGSGLARSFFEHPLICSLYGGGYKGPRTTWWWPTALTRGCNLPSYIPSRNFALALMDMAARGPAVNHVNSHPATGAISFDSVRANIVNLGSPSVQRALLTALDSAQGDLQQAQKNIEAWYDSSMDRVSGWYKRSTQWMLFAIGLGVAIGVNINTLAIADYLYREKPAREALVSRAQSVAGDPKSPAMTYQEVRKELESSNLPIGWSGGSLPPLISGKQPTGKWNEWMLPLIGWLITAFAATLGAPFWFDLLNKMMVIRSTVKPHEKSPEESSEDRQTSRDQASAPPPEATRTIPLAGPAAMPAPIATASAAPAPVAPPSDPDHIDGCDVDIQDFTSDEELPVARGGVA